jgi:hypothetical protein
MHGRRAASTAVVLLAIALPGCGGTSTARPVASTGARPCSADPHALAGDAVPPAVSFAPAERFPHVRACVWWSLTLPAYRVEARVDGAGVQVVSVCRFDGHVAADCTSS